MLSQRERDVVRVYVRFGGVFLPGIAIVTVIVILHPIGWLWSLVAAAVVFEVGTLAAVKVTKRLLNPTFEEDSIAMQDKVLGLNKEPPKNWFLGPF